MQPAFGHRVLCDRWGGGGGGGGTGMGGWLTVNHCHSTCVSHDEVAGRNDSF